MVAHAERRSKKESAASQAAEKVARMGVAAKREANAVKAQLAHKAEQLTQVIKEETDEFLEQRKGKVAARIERIGSVMRHAAQVLDVGEIKKVAEYVDMAAIGATAASKYLEEREVGEIAEDAADLVRRHPLAALGAMAILGLAVGRFAKAGQTAAASTGERRTRE